MTISTSIRTIFCVLLFDSTQFTQANLFLDFGDPNSGPPYYQGFDGNMVGHTSNLFSDPATGVSGLITTRKIIPIEAVTFASYPYPVSSYLTEGAGALGVSDPGKVDCDNCFDSGESWTFDWDVDAALTEITFYGDLNFQTSIQSDAWKSLGLGPISSSVAYEGTSGKFTFTAKPSSYPHSQLQHFTLSDMTGGVPLPVPAGIDITIAGIGSPAPLDSIGFDLLPVTASVPDSLPRGGLLGLVSSLIAIRAASRRIKL